MQYDETNMGAVDVMVAELLVATADHADATIDPAVQEVLGLVRDKMNMDAVFVRVYREDAGGPPVPDPLEASWGQQVLSERLLQPASPADSFQSAAVVLSDGAVYGTLCALSRGPWAVHRDMKILRSTAQLIAHKLDPQLRPAPVRRRSMFEGDTTLPLQGQPA